ncbi:MAG: hypothetical protein V3V87_22770 [Methylobacterium ajmalii]
MTVPSDNVAKRVTPTSMPTRVVDGWTGRSTSRSVWTETCHLPAFNETVTCPTSPSTAREARQRIQPSLGMRMRPFGWSSSTFRGWRKASFLPFLLNLGNSARPSKKLR